MCVVVQKRQRQHRSAVRLCELSVDHREQLVVTSNTSIVEVFFDPSSSSVRDDDDDFTGTGRGGAASELTAERYDEDSRLDVDGSKPGSASMLTSKKASASNDVVRLDHGPIGGLRDEMIYVVKLEGEMSTSVKCA